MSELENAKWIWCLENAKPDEYAEFYTAFEYDGGECTINISADSNYALYINGKLSAFGQYADFPHDKVYDSVDITGFCKNGKASY